MIIPDGWIGHIKDGVGPVVVVTDPLDLIGWKAAGYEFRPFRYMDEKPERKETGK